MLPVALLLLQTAAVGLHTDDGSLRGRLALLLVDEGLDVYASADSETATRVVRRGDRFLLTIGRAPSTSIGASAPAVALMEIAQHISLAHQQGSHPTTDQPLVRLVFQADVPFNERAAVADTLLEEGFGLTSDEHRATAGRCAALVDGTVTVRNGERRDPCRAPKPPDVLALTKPPPTDPTPIIPHRPVVEEEPASVASTTSTTSAVTTNTAAPPRPPPPPPPAETTRIAGSPPEPPARVPWRWTLGAVGGVTARQNGVDPTAILDLEILPRWWGIRLSGMLIHGGRQPLRVWEAVMGAGPSARFEIAAAWSVGAAILVGARWHDFRLDGEDQGGRWDAAVDVPLTLDYRRLHPLTVALYLRPGLDSRSRRHLQDTEVLWERGAFRVSAGLAIGATFAP